MKLRAYLCSAAVLVCAAPFPGFAAEPRTPQATRFSGIGPDVAPMCSMDLPIQINMTVDERTVLRGADALINVEIVALANLRDISVAVQADGAVRITQPVSLRAATLSRHELLTLTIPVHFTELGLSGVTVEVRATSASHDYPFMRKKTFNVYLRDDRAFVGMESQQRLRLTAVEEDWRAGIITEEEARAQTKAITRLEGTFSQVPIAPQPIPAAFANLPRIEPPQPDGPSGVVRSSPRVYRGDTCTIRVMGTVQWADENGNLHPSIGMNVQIRDDDTVGSEEIFTLAPDTNGNYDTGDFCWDDGVLAGDPDIFVRFRTENSAVDVEDGCFLCGTYETDSAIHDEFGGGTIVENFTCANTGTGPACSVLDAGSWIAIWTAQLRGGSFLDSVRIDWPGDPAGTNYQCFTDRINLVQGDRFDWDTVFHEYGHKVMCEFDFDDNPGGMHCFGDCTAITQMEKEDGLQISWGEAWPTYNGTSGQQVLGLASLGVPRVGDTMYQDMEDSNFAYSLENNGNDLDPTMNVSGGLGEDNEVAVQRVLWDLFDSNNDSRDVWSISAQSLFDLWRNTDITMPHEAWGLLRGSALGDGEAELAIGEILVDQGIGPEIQGPADGIVISGPTVTFMWLPRVGCDPSFAGNSFTVRFFDAVTPFALRHAVAVGNTTSYAMTQGDFDTLIAGGHFVRWAVDGSNTSDPNSGPYMGDNNLLGLNRPPMCSIVTPPDAECQGGTTTVSLDATATDPDGDVLIKTWSSTTCPNRMFSDQNQEDTDITIDTFPPCELTCMATLTVFDGFEEATCDVTITIVDTTAPTFTTLPMDETVECDPAVNPAEFAAWLADDGGAVAADTCGTTDITNDSTGLSDDCGATGSEEVTFTAEDQCENTSSANATFAVVDTMPPTIFCPVEPVVVMCNQPEGINSDEVVFDVFATDVCGSTMITDNRPPIFPPSCGGLWPQTVVTFTATDECLLQSSCDVTVEVKGAMCCPGYVDTELTLMPADIDFTVQPGHGGGPVTTKANFDIWNQNEIRFSGLFRCITCWDSTLLSLYGPPNHFLVSNIQTDLGKARIDGVAAPQCPESVETGLFGVVAREITFAGCPLPAIRSALTPVARGAQDGRIAYSPIDQRSAGDDALRVGPPENVASAGENGSLLIWPKVEIRWDFQGNILRDTFLELTNDGSAEVGFQLYLVNGEPPTDAVTVFGVLVERAHDGWNAVDEQIVLTPNEPTYWSANSGAPKGITPFRNLDGAFPFGRPDPDPRNPSGRMVRGFVVGWVVSPEGTEVQWNHIKGAANIVDYREATAHEYDAWSMDCVSGAADLEACDAVPGQLLLDGLEYDAAPEKLLMDFFTPGSVGLSQRQVLINLQHGHP